MFIFLRDLIYNRQMEDRRGRDSCSMPGGMIRDLPDDFLQYYLIRFCAVSDVLRKSIKNPVHVSTYYDLGHSH